MQKFLLTLLWVVVGLGASLSAQTIDITSPNGGENLDGCTAHTITWTAVGTSQSFSIDYSIDNGTNWTSEASFYNSTNGTFSWTIPNVTSSNCLVRVYDSNNPATIDVSDAIFSINGPLILLTPNGGENWVSGTTRTISWAASGTSNIYRLEYSTNNGGTWTTIINNYNGTSGSYSWLIPNVNTSQAVVRITDINNSPCMSDKSNSVFNIISTIDITSPDGGENFTAGAGPNGGNFNMDNNPVTLSSGNFYDSGGKTGDYYYIENFTKTFSPDNPLAKLQVAFSSLVTYDNNDYLRIYNGPSTSDPLIGTYSGNNVPGIITSTHKTGALTITWSCSNSYTYRIEDGWEASITSIGPATQPITWTYTGTSQVYDIEYSTNSGLSWTRIVSDFPSAVGVFQWPVPNTPTTTARVRVIDDQNSSIVGESAADFTIGAAQPLYVVCAPNGGETWYAGETYSVTWGSAFVAGASVLLEYSTDNGGTWSTIIASTINDGQYDWQVPNTPSTTSLLRISEVGNAANFDVSDANFTIAPHITVGAPNGGESLLGCNSFSLTWYTGGTSDLFDIEFSSDGGGSWSTVVSNLSRTTATATYNWTVNNVTSSNCMVRVSDSNDGSKTDVSDAVFAVQSTANVVTNAPNGGEYWVAGSVQNITYTMSGGVTSVNIQYSTDNGSSWNTIANNQSSGSYSWTIPNVDSDIALVRVQDVSNSCNSDQSNAVLSLVSEIVVNAPNGGEITTAITGLNGNVYLMNNTPATVTTGNFYDSGGKNGNYYYLESFTKTFNPYNPTHKLQFTLTDFQAYDTDDRLRIYNGPTTSSPLLATISSSTSLPVTYTSTHKTGALTFTWSCSNSYTYRVEDGWEAWFTCLSPDNMDINWGITGTSNSYHLEYSTNSGSNWTRIASDVDANVGTFSWPVPNIPTTNARVRVIDAGNNGILDESDADFTIGSPDPLYVVCAPNGGETWYAGNTETITWASIFTTNANVKLEYSIDNGNSWILIVGSTFNDGEYDWVIPDDPTTQALVRVSDASNPAFADESDAVFTIKPYVTVDAPNGGQTFTGCDNFALTWSAGGTSGNFEVELSTDNGSTWISVATVNSSNTTTVYNWTVNNLNSSQCLIRVYDSNDPAKGDTSDAVFTINQTLNVQVSQPNGGEAWVAGNTYPITYSIQGGVSLVNIYYSLDSGTTWVLIASNQSSGAYNWTVPNVDSDVAFIKVQDVSTPCNADLSNSVLSLISEVVITTPNGGETLVATGGLNGGAFTMNNTPVTLTTGNFYDSGGKNGNYYYLESYSKTFNPSNPTHKLQLVFTDFTAYDTDDRIRVYDGPSTSDPYLGLISSSTSIPQTFTSTHKTGALTVTWSCSNSYTYRVEDGWEAYINSLSPANTDVNWNITGTSNEYHIEYSTNSGSTWNRILSDVPATLGYYSWPVPNTPTSLGRIRIVDTGNNAILDQNDADFTIAAALPLYVVCTPNGGETWYAGETEAVTWNSAFTSNINVMIEYSIDNGATWNLIVNSTVNDGTYDWTIPNTPSIQSLVRVSDASNSAYADTSDAVFTIAPYVTVVAPNGGQNLTGCNNYTITWNAGGTSNDYTVQLSTDGGSSWSTLANVSSSSHTISYNWTVTNVNSSNCLIRVYDTNDPTKGDTSDASFTLNQTLNVQVFQPNGGEVWVAGNAYPITYNTQGGVTNVNIYYSLDSGATWVTIATNQSGGVYNWTVPNVDSDQALIRVRDVATTCNSDESNTVLSLVSEVVISTPNGGETLSPTGGPNGGSFTMNNTPVTLTTGNFYDSGGKNGDYYYLESYTKTFTPYNPLQKLRVNISNFLAYDTDDRLRIYDGPTTSSPLLATISVSSSIPQSYVSSHKTGALTFYWSCSNSYTYRVEEGWEAYISSEGPGNTPVNWSITGTSNEYHIEYSTNSGVSWNRILSDVPATTGAYSWPVPNAPTTQGRVRIVDTGNNAILDESDADFTISPAIPLYAICTPNGGEQWSAGNTEDITWNSAFATNAFVNIEYSLDSGATWLSVTASTINDGEYSWVIPNTPSTQALVRVSDASNSAYADTSDVIFNLNPFVDLINPDGGQSLIGCDIFNISWNAGATSGDYTVDLSTDAGATWTTVTTLSNSNSTVSYNWTINNVNSNNCLIRVYDTNDPSKTDTSDVVFSIAPTLNVQLGQPNGGESWIAGNSYQINYTMQGGVTAVNLQYSTNNGVSWNTIANNQSAGFYLWTIPNVDSDVSLVRAVDVSNSCNYDISASNFSLVSEVTVLTPDGGDTLKATVVGVASNSFNMNNNPLSIAHANFYDSGGKNGNYYYLENYTKTFSPLNPTHKLQVDFSAFQAYDSDDRLRIYDGPSTSDPLLGTISSTVSMPRTYTSTHKSGALTVTWSCSNSYTYRVEDGWEAIITSISPDNHDLNWNIIGTSGLFDLEYSTNSGLNWTTIVEDYPTTTGLFSWAVPNNPTNQGRVRVLDAGNNNILDVSNSDFVIEEADPVIVICAPNGGETWFAGDIRTITWLDAFILPATVTLEYSNDNGTTWNLITNSTANDGEYDWTVPNDPTQQALVRITENGGNGYAKVSDSVFTLMPHVTVTAPNGGQSLIGCQSFSLTWAAGGTSNLYDIELSTDGGSTWTMVQDNYSTSGNYLTYAWTVDNVSSSNCLVRVTDDADPAKTDVSDSPFTISPIYDVQVNSPNGGEFWVAGTTQSIIYALNGGVTNVKIQYSIDSGTTWATISNNTSGGAYSWTIPNTPSSLALIKVTDVSNSCKFDVSNSVFNLISEIAITSPNGGEIWQGQVGTPGGIHVMNTNTVTLNSGNFYDSGGKSGNYSNYENTTKTFYPDVPTNKLQFVFTGFQLYNSSDYLRIYDGPSASAPYLGSFTNSNNPGTITSTHSTGALTFVFVTNYNSVSTGWEAYINSINGTPSQNLTWNITGTTGVFDLEYTTDGGSVWTRIVSDYPSTTGIWPWQVPNTPSSTCLVRVIDAGNNNIVDESDNLFEISPAFPLLVDPNGGETAFSGIVYNVRWAAPTFLTPNVQLEYSTNSGVSWTLIEAFTFNDGAYDWVPPLTTVPFYNCLLRVSESGNTIKNDVSDGLFTISPAVRVTTPNSNSGNWRGCTQSTIDWVAGATTNYLIELSIDSGSTWATVESNYYNTNSVVNYNWSIPNTPSNKCLVRVTDVNNPSRTDVSDSVFTITPTITLTQPTFGGQIQGGTAYNITWNSNVVSNFYDIDYSIDGGSNWLLIVANHFTTTDSYTWNVPNLTSSNCLVRVRDNLNNCKEDVSDYPFTIQAAAPSITLTNPNGGDTLSGCSNYNIDWTELITSNFYNLEYSADGGQNWITIASNHYTTTGGYTWNVPNISTSTGLIRITDAADGAKTDVSNQSFVIEQSVTASISSSGATAICIGDTVFLTSNSPIGNVWAPFGQTSQTIAVSQTGVYSVAVTNAGCVASSQPVSVSVNSLPAVPTIAANGSTTICAGDQIILTSSSPSGNVWTPGAQTTQAISVGTTGSYSVQVTNQFGCQASSIPVFVTVNPLPQTPVAGANSPAVVGGNINLTATLIPGATYSWTGPNGFTSSMQNPNISAVTNSNAGVYYVTATVNGCESAAGSVVVAVTSSSGIVNISGTILSEMGSPVRTTTVRLSGTSIDSMTTALNGQWDYDVATGQPYTVTPEKMDDVVTNNGITTLDVILMRRHILNADTLSSPYKIISADVNLSGNVSTLDLILTRTVILQTNLTFPNGQLWNFVNSDFSFANPISPWPFEDDRTYAAAIASVGQDFVALKLGDVNNTWDPNVARTPWAGEIGVSLDDVEAVQGEEILVPVRVSDFKEVSGYQFTLEWDKNALDYIGVEDGQLAGHFGEGNIAEGQLVTSWDEESGAAVSLEDGSMLFQVRFRVKADLETESLLFVSSGMAQAEAYTDDLEILTFQTEPARVKVLEQASGAEAATLDGFALSQNYPNPFDETTELNFRVPQSCEVDFVIYDLTGQEVRRFKDFYEAGNHNLSWNGTDQEGRKISGGIYYIRMQTRDFNATRKMIYIRK